MSGEAQLEVLEVAESGGDIDVFDGVGTGQSFIGPGLWRPAVYLLWGDSDKVPSVPGHLGVMVMYLVGAINRHGPASEGLCFHPRARRDQQVHDVLNGDPALLGHRPYVVAVRVALGDLEGALVSIVPILRAGFEAVARQMGRDGAGETDWRIWVDVGREITGAYGMGSRTAEMSLDSISSLEADLNF